MPRADPLVAAVVPLFLLFQALFEAAHDLFEIEVLDGVALFLGQLAHLDRVLQPIEELLRDGLRLDVNALEMGCEREVEVVEVALRVDEDRARDVVEAVEGRAVEIGRERLREGDGLLRADGDLALAKLVEELDWSTATTGTSSHAGELVGEGDHVLLFLEERAEERDRLIELHLAHAAALENDVQSISSLVEGFACGGARCRGFRRTRAASDRRACPSDPGGARPRCAA